MRRVVQAFTPERPLLFSVVISAGYALAYLGQAWPQPLSFWSHSWMDDGDGLVMLWNLWLAGEQGLNLFRTDYLFAPGGVSLLGHTVVPLKSWLGALLPLPLLPSLNLLVLLSFALAGTFTFWLARRFSSSVPACLMAGWAFTFTGFHWAHAQGHLNLVSIEMLPLYALVWVRFDERPDWTRAAVVAAVMLATALTDYYFALYCGLFSVVLAAGRRMHWRAAGRVLVLVLPTSGLLALAVLQLLWTEGLHGAHDPSRSPLDPVALFVPGGHSWLAALTRPVWERFPGTLHEHSVHLGLTLWLVILWKGRSKLWWGVLAVFLVLALGERLTVLGHTLPVPLPYQGLEWLVPPLALGGVPVRMAVMVALAASVLFAISLPRFGRNALPLALLLVVELLPGPRPTTRPEVPGWVDVLAARPDRAPLYDPSTNPREAMYYQTEHGHPISGGHLARIPAGALVRNDRYFALFQQSSPDPLVRAGFGYILIRDYAIGGATLLWRDTEQRLYHMVPAGR